MLLKNVQAVLAAQAPSRLLSAGDKSPNSAAQRAGPPGCSSDSPPVPIGASSSGNTPSHSPTETLQPCNAPTLLHSFFATKWTRTLDRKFSWCLRQGGPRPRGRDAWCLGETRKEDSLQILLLLCDWVWELLSYEGNVVHWSRVDGEADRVPWGFAPHGRTSWVVGSWCYKSDKRYYIGPLSVNQSNNIFSILI